MLTLHDVPRGNTLEDRMFLTSGVVFGGAMLIWALAMLCMMLMAGPPSTATGTWFNISLLEGGVIYQRADGQATCQLRATAESIPCVSGKDLRR